MPKGGKVLLGYFFGPKFSELPPSESLPKLSAPSAVFTCLFGDLGLHNGEWTLLGPLAGFDPKDWPLPTFARTDAVSGAAKLIDYRSDDLITEVRSLPCSPQEAAKHPKDGVNGYGAVEIALTIRLA